MKIFLKNLQKGVDIQRRVWYIILVNNTERCNNAEKEDGRMMKEEFETIAGYEVSDKDYYNIIEPMYMATNLTKDDFVKTISKKRFALKPISTIKREMRKCADSLKETCDHYTDTETLNQLYKLIGEYIDRKGYGESIGYVVTSDQTPFKCSYPAVIEFYGRNDYRTIDKITLVA